MTKNNLHVQSCFTKSNQSAIKKIYNINSEENILLAFWAGHFYSLGLREVGFVFTDKALYWNCPAIKESGSGDEKPEGEHIKSGFLDSSSTDFSEVYTKSVEGKTSLVLKTSDLSYCFEFENSPKNLELLENALRSYFTSNLDLKQFEESDESYSVLFTFLLLKDFCGEAFLAAKTKLAQVFKKSAESTKEKVQNFADAKSEEFREWKEENDRKRAERQAFKEEEKAKKAEKEQSLSQKIDNEISFWVKTLHFVRHTFDLCADLIFILAVLIIVKPSITSQDNEFIKKIGSINVVEISEKFKLESFLPPIDTLNITEEVLRLSRFYAILLFISFILIKIPVIMSCKRSRKSVSLLLLVILACITPLINCYFLIFSLVSLLVLLTLQFSMGFSKAVIQIKSCLFAVSVVYGYLTIHLVQNPGLCRQIVNWFSLPAKWW